MLNVLLVLGTIRDPPQEDASSDGYRTRHKTVAPKVYRSCSCEAAAHLFEGRGVGLHGPAQSAVPGGVADRVAHVRVPPLDLPRARVALPVLGEVLRVPFNKRAAEWRNRRFRNPMGARKRPEIQNVEARSAERPASGEARAGTKCHQNQGEWRQRKRYRKRRGRRGSV